MRHENSTAPNTPKGPYGPYAPGRLQGAMHVARAAGVAALRCLFGLTYDTSSSYNSSYSSSSSSSSSAYMSPRRREM
jgi:hypothetical protein